MQPFVNEIESLRGNFRKIVKLIETLEARKFRKKENIRITIVAEIIDLRRLII